MQPHPVSSIGRRRRFGGRSRNPSRPFALLAALPFLTLPAACAPEADEAASDPAVETGAAAAGPDAGAPDPSGAPAAPGGPGGGAQEWEPAGAAPGAGQAGDDHFGYAGPVTDAGRAVVEGEVSTAPADVDPEAPIVEADEDREIIHQSVVWAREQGLDALPVGEIIGVVGATFVGTPYEPQTLEVPGPERLVVNLRAMDCVTFVEQMMALAHVIRSAPHAELEDDEALAERFQEVLTGIRYRDGVIDGYVSRLHYFSEWMADNEARGIVHDLTRELGGRVDERPIHFMSSHPDAYPRLEEDPEKVDRIREVEERLNGSQRFYIPQEEIADRKEEIRTGDIIAATSTVDGLDVAHTGIALWHQGRLHLLHAPLEDGTVEITPRPLVDRIQEIGNQDGIMVGRPLDPAPSGG